MPRELTRQLDEAVAEVFAVMLKLGCTAAPASTFPRDGSCVSATVQFSGTMDGSCTLYFNPATVARLASTLVGMPPEEVPAELCEDTAGELCNMIAGSWKTRQPAMEAACNLSCPSLVIGPASTPPQLFEESITLLYSFESHHFAVHLTVE